MDINVGILLMIAFFYTVSRYQDVGSILSLARRKVLSRYYIKTTGTVTNVDVLQSETSKGDKVFWTNITYTFEADGATCERVFSQDGDHGPDGDKKFQAGGSLSVQYDPMDPNQCITSVDSLWDYGCTLVVLVFLVAMLILLLLGWLVTAK